MTDRRDEESGLFATGLLTSRKRRVFPAKEGKSATVLYSFVVASDAGSMIVEHWGELEPARIPAVGSAVRLPVRVRPYLTCGRPSARLVWGENTRLGEDF